MDKFISRCLIIFLFCVLTGCSSAASFFADGVLYEKEKDFRIASDLYDHAKGLYEKEKYEEAKEYFQQYLSEHPDSTIYHIALYYLGHCHQETFDSEEALRIYNTVIDSYPDETFSVEYAQKRIGQIKASRNSSLSASGITATR